MESSIAEFLKRKLACELLPTVVQFTSIGTRIIHLVSVFSLARHLAGFSPLAWRVAPDSHAVRSRISEQTQMLYDSCAMSHQLTH